MPTPNFVDKTIWTGDNLDILRGINSECVDLIYLDPPFNSNRNYEAPVGSKAAGAAFKDTWTLSDLDVAWMGLIADEHPAIASLLSTAGQTHGKGMQSYLCMMAVRLLELHRVLKPTGSIYLHCDPTASHYLKMLMDAIFGARNFRNDISWQRTTGRSSGKRFGSVHDSMLFYTKSEDYTWNNVYLPHSKAQLAKYSGRDDRGAFTLSDVSAPGLNGYRYDLGLGEKMPVRGYRMPEDEARKMLSDGILMVAVGKTPRRKRYLSDSPGAKVNDMILDIRPLNSQAKERTGYPTQKPLALLERIIKASSNEDDVVLDPFAGCATACVAAENLGRKWVGIDLSPKAVELVNLRLQDSMGGLFHNRLVIARTDIPRRTDIDAPVHYRKNKHVLYGQQEGQCAGCKLDFPFKIFEVDHIIPRSRGGTDHLDNLQLLCSHCNRIKGNRPQEYLMAQIRRE